MKNIFFAFILVGLSTISRAQQAVLLDDVKVYVEGRELPNPWTGGLKAGQFSKVDLDGDGVKDLVVFDRNSVVVSTFLNQGGTGEINYVYAPEYAKIFPSANTFLILHDFNGDGIEDVFKDPSDGGVAGIEVWRGKRDENGLYFELVLNRDDYWNILYYLGNGNPINVYNAPIDIPAVFDVDGDGDTDILTFESGGSFLNYYRNQAVEKNLGLDTFDFAFRLSDTEHFCFGKFRETMFSSDVILSSTSTDCASGIVSNPNSNSGPRHAGSTVTAFDYECDGDADLIIGDFLTNNITFLKNGGSPNNSLITEQDSRFPSYDVPADMEVFLSSFYIDINNDDKKDLIVTPNQINLGKNQNHVLLYLNKGTTCDPVFQLEQEDFLIENMLHFSRASHPLFTDYNADGLTDILIGSGGKLVDFQTPTNEIYVLENTGTQTTPEFDVITSDYLNISQFPDNLGSISLEAADIDNDHDLDLFIGIVGGTVIYYENIAGPDAPFQFANPVFDWMDFFVGSNSAPEFYDFDGDGLLDVAFGEGNNEFNMYKNIGTKEEPMFNPDPTADVNLFQFGNIYINNDFFTKQFTPVFFKNGAELNFMQGVNSGAIRLFNNITPGPLDTFNLLEANFGDIYVGFRSTIDLGDINNDGKYELVVGNQRGGLHIYGTNLVFNPSLSVKNTIPEIEGRIFPNPVRKDLNLDIDFKSKAQLRIYSSTGELVYDEEMDNSFDVLNLQHLIPGIYHLTALSNEGKFISKFTKVD